MIDLPQWLENKVTEIECPNCGRNIQLETIVGIGIKEHKEGSKKQSYLFIEHTCGYCSKTYGFDLTTYDVKEFVFDMIEKYGLISDEVDDSEMMNVNIDDKAEKDEENGISQAEVDTFKRTMKDCDTWIDVMECAGINSEDLERYTKNSEKDK